MGKDKPLDGKQARQLEHQGHTDMCPHRGEGGFLTELLSSPLLQATQGIFNNTPILLFISPHLPCLYKVPGPLLSTA